jgi:hypothetical protein
VSEVCERIRDRIAPVVQVQSMIPALDVSRQSAESSVGMLD